jgi:hypothetical protein
MDEQFRSSFIPKKPLVNRDGSKAGFDYYGRRRSSGSSTVAVISFFILVLSLIALGVTHLLVWLVDRDIARIQVALQDQRVQFQPDEINTFKQFDNRLKLAESVLANHTVPSEVLSLLSATTLPTVRFTSFNFAEEFVENTGTGTAGAPPQTGSTPRFTVSLEGDAGGFRDIVLQAGEFEEDTRIKSSSFSDFRSNEAGRVSFSVELVLDPKLVHYPSFVERVPAGAPEEGAAVEMPNRPGRPGSAREAQTP